MRRLGTVAAGLGVAALLAVAAGAVWMATDQRVAGPVHAVALRLKVPNLADPGMIRRGAVHYDLVCATCHASPAAPRRGAALDLSPPAPVLHRRLADWPPSLLFQIVRDGVDGSAMPAWPAPDRADEIWAMVAFLEVLPDLSPADYATLAGLDRPEGPPGPEQTCVRCHDAPDAAAPRLDLQHAAYLGDALRAYRSGTRSSGFMQHLAARMTDAEIETLATRLARSDAPEASPPRGPAPEIAVRGAPARQIAACNACHDPEGPARAAFPVLAGQHAAYLATQLALFADTSPHHPVTRGGGPFVGLMQHAAEGLTDTEIAELAAWFAAHP